MIGGSKPRGYTVVEIMIFLAVSGLMAVSTMTLISGRQSNAEFSQAVRDLDSNIRDIINDINTGYYPNPDKVECTQNPLGPGTGVVIIASLSPTEQGSNSDCIFIGKVIQFAPQGTNFQGIRIYSIAGQRLNAAGLEVKSVLEAKGKTIAKSSTDPLPPDFYDDVDFGGSIAIKKVRFTYKKSGVDTTLDSSAIGFFTSFNQYVNNSLTSDSTSTNLIPFAPTTAPFPTSTYNLDQDQLSFVNNLNKDMTSANTPSIDSFTLPADNTLNPTGKVEVCIQSMHTNKWATLAIGGDGTKLGTKLVIEESRPAWCIP